jgi:hypothetical protein
MSETKFHTHSTIYIYIYIYSFFTFCDVFYMLPVVFVCTLKLNWYYICVGFSNYETHAIKSTGVVLQKMPFFFSITTGSMNSYVYCSLSLSSSLSHARTRALTHPRMHAHTMMLKYSTAKKLLLLTMVW